jgi:hypothetical protein
MKQSLAYCQVLPDGFCELWEPYGMLRLGLFRCERSYEKYYRLTLRFDNLDPINDNHEVAADARSPFMMPAGSRIGFISSHRLERMLIMKRISACIALLTLLLALGCAGERTQENVPSEKPANIPPPAGSETIILQSWQGDYPVDRLQLLPEGQRDTKIGFINDAVAFQAVWEAFKPGENDPQIDFDKHLVLFARNIEFYNRMQIAKVTLSSGTAEIIAMETKSAMPIEDRVAMSMAVVVREGITAVRLGDKVIPIDQ